MEKYCVFVDWLEVTCYGGIISRDGFFVDGKYYSIHEENRETAMFKRYFIVKYKGLDFAYIRQQPRLARMKKGLTCVKLANRVLYCEKYIPFLLGLLKELHLQYHGITRLDLAYDCNKFADGRRPSKFIRDFLFKPLDSVGGIYLAGCRTFKVHGSKGIGDDGTINYISFGCSSSDKRAYIYDKTKELNEVKDKPWIRDAWSRNGLVSDGKIHVWRSEISIKGQGKDLLNLETGQLFPLNPKYLYVYENIVKVFHFYASKVFDFRINTGQKNRRNFSHLCLFDKAIVVTCVPKRVSNLCDSGRSEKVCKNKLIKLSKTYIDLSTSVRHNIGTTIEFLESLSAIKQARHSAELYKHYLDTFACSRFLTDEDFAYLEACSQKADAAREDYAEWLYNQYLERRGARAMCELESDAS